MSKKFLWVSILFVLFIALILPFAAKRLDGAVLPDTEFSYNTDDMAKMIGALSEEQRLEYIYSRLWMDVLWPLVYGSFFFMALGYLLEGTFILKLKYVPWVAVVLDYFENFNAALHMKTYPKMLPMLNSVGSFATSMKWCCLVLAGGLLIVGIVYKGVARCRKIR